MPVGKHFLVVFSLILAALTSGFALASIPVEVYAKLPAMSKFAISHDASRIAYRQTDGVRDYVIVFDLNEGKRIGIVDVSAVDPDNVRFIDNNKVLLHASQNTRLFGFRGRFDVSVAAVYNIKTNKTHKLLQPGYGIYEGQSGLGKIVGISSDRKSAYMPAWISGSSYSLLRVNLEKERAQNL